MTSMQAIEIARCGLISALEIGNEMVERRLSSISKRKMVPTMDCEGDDFGSLVLDRSQSGWNMTSVANYNASRKDMNECNC